MDNHNERIASSSQRRHMNQHMYASRNGFPDPSAADGQGFPSGHARNQGYPNPHQSDNGNSGGLHLVFSREFLFRMLIQPADDDEEEQLPTKLYYLKRYQDFIYKIKAKLLEEKANLIELDKIISDSSTSKIHNLQFLKQYIKDGEVHPNYEREKLACRRRPKRYRDDRRHSAHGARQAGRHRGNITSSNSNGQSAPHKHNVDPRFFDELNHASQQSDSRRMGDHSRPVEDHHRQPNDVSHDSMRNIQGRQSRIGKNSNNSLSHFGTLRDVSEGVSRLSFSNDHSHDQSLNPSKANPNARALHKQPGQPGAEIAPKRSNRK